jgi:hypothetical protein
MVVELQLPKDPIALCMAASGNQQMNAVEAKMAEYPSVDQPLKHRFAPGLYVREVFNPADSLITTKIHASEHVFFLMQGTMRIYVEGEGWRVLSAPDIGITHIGTRRVIYAVTDVVFVTAHPNPDNGTDIQAIEERLIHKHEYQKNAPPDLDREDFERLLLELGISQKWLDDFNESATDHVSIMGTHFSSVMIRPSPIAGIGMFTKAEFKGLGVVGPARIGPARTELGRYVNHSMRPNCVMSETSDGGVNLVAFRDISAGEELTVNYRQARCAAGRADKLLT